MTRPAEAAELTGHPSAEAGRVLPADEYGDGWRYMHEARRKHPVSVRR